tara:strand:- start:311 stop:622 length:312 start_codon:yes stop_codon:yes gene_type:complete
MTDEQRKMLECAARAVGLNPLGSINGRFVVKNGPNPADNFDPYEWNPLEDDADAFRLARDLKMDVDFESGYVHVDGMDPVREVDGSGMKHAITLIAAIIGGYE